jgi:uncharacterized small protein (DUF1192 family)
MYKKGWLIWTEEKILNWIFWSQESAEKTVAGTVIGPLDVEECQRLLSIYR